MDRWILGDLHLLIKKVTAELDGYDAFAAGRAIADFVDELSNWYVRRSRRRFWKSEADSDKIAAYLTLNECSDGPATGAVHPVPGGGDVSESRGRTFP
jgi:isoleucyl-tRNA synthetase